VLGSAEFKEEAIETFEETDIDKMRMALNNKPSTNEIIRMIFQYSKTSEKDIREKLKGRRASYPNRRFAMYACWRYGDTSQKQLADAFGLSHSCSAAFSINQVKKEVIEGKWRKQVD